MKFLLIILTFISKSKNNNQIHKQKHNKNINKFYNLPFLDFINFKNVCRFVFSMFKSKLLDISGFQEFEYSEKVRTKIKCSKDALKNHIFALINEKFENIAM